MNKIVFVDSKTGEKVAGPFSPAQAREWARKRLCSRRTLSDVVAKKLS